MHPNIQALRKALEEEKTPYTHIPGFPDSVVALGRSFLHTATPFNDESVSALCRDKAAAYAVLFGKVKMPRTMAFVDPNGGHPELAVAKDIDEIVRVSSSVPYPAMVKMNQGERGQHVYFVRNADECRRAFRAIFNKESRDYDYIALVQEYIEPIAEFKIAVAAGEFGFAYRRDDFAVVRGATLEALRDMAEAAIESLDMSWGSIDAIESREGEMFFIEANTRPGYGGFIAAKGDEKIKALYKSALKLKKK